MTRKEMADKVYALTVRAGVLAGLYAADGSAEMSLALTSTYAKISALLDEMVGEEDAKALH